MQRANGIGGSFSSRTSERPQGSPQMATSSFFFAELLHFYFTPPTHPIILFFHFILCFSSSLNPRSPLISTTSLHRPHPSVSLKNSLSKTSTLLDPSPYVQSSFFFSALPSLRPELLSSPTIFQLFCVLLSRMPSLHHLPPASFPLSFSLLPLLFFYLGPPNLSPHSTAASSQEPQEP